MPGQEDIYVHIENENVTGPWIDGQLAFQMDSEWTNFPSSAKWYQQVTDADCVPSLRL